MTVFEQWWQPIEALVKSGQPLNFFQTLYKEIYMNAIFGDRWLQYLNGLLVTLEVSLLAIIFGHAGISDAIYNGIHSVVAAPKWASLAYALTFVAICFLAGWPLFRKRIYIKI